MYFRLLYLVGDRLLVLPPAHLRGLAPDTAMVLFCTWLLEIGVYVSALLVCAWDTELGSFYFFIPYFSLPLLAGNGYMLFLLGRLDA